MNAAANAPRLATEKRALQAVLGVLSLVPLIGVGIGFIRGTAFFLEPGQSVKVNLDNQFRYLSGVYACVTGGLWYVLGHVESRGVVLRVVAGGVVSGAVGRVISMASHGLPSDPSMVGGVVLEGLVVPLLVLWQASFARRARPHG